MADVLIRNGLIEKIAASIDAAFDQEIDAQDLHLLPGCIDNQVHFREPGLLAGRDLQSRPLNSGFFNLFINHDSAIQVHTALALC